MLYFFIAITIVLTTLLFYSVRRNMQMDDKFAELGEQIEESLDILNQCYFRISKTAETPVTSDDPVVQQLLSDVADTRHAILLVANKVITFNDEEYGDDVE